MDDDRALVDDPLGPPTDREPSASGWRRRAACRGMDPNLFVPLSGRGEQDLGERGNETIRRAITVCTGCPVTTECLDFALRAGERYGVWGGVYLSDRALRRLAAERRRGAA